MTKEIKRIGGKIVVNYGGQEHATPNYEHQKLDKLVQESFLPFEARGWNSIMFYDHSRWSRDNNKSSTYIDVLRTNGIRFFTLTKEWDLRSPDDMLMLGINTVTNEYQAMLQTKKSLESRIYKAKQGFLSTGKAPLGRKFNKNGEWSVNEEEKKKYELAAKIYLERDIGFTKLGKLMGIKSTTIHRVLTQTAGDSWVQHFRSDRLGIDEAVPIKIPPLLDKITIKKIREKAKRQRSYHPGGVKRKYLLNGLIYCDDCGKRLFGQTGGKENSPYIYYRHPQNVSKEHFESVQKKYNLTSHRNPKILKCFSGVRAKIIDDIVLQSIIEMANNIKIFKEALLTPHPNSDERKESIKELQIIEKSIENIMRKEKNLISAIENDFKIDGLKKRSAELNNQRNDLIKQKEAIEEKIFGMPSDEEIEHSKDLMLKQINSFDLNNLTFEKKKELIKIFCQGKDSHGRLAGIYIGNSTELEIKNVVVTGFIGDILGVISKDSDIEFALDSNDVIKEKMMNNSLINNFKACSLSP